MTVADARSAVARRPARVLAAVATLVTLGIGAIGCAPMQNPLPHATVAPYAGPSYLRGTVDSFAGTTNVDYIPVSGYGIVVGLDGTGSDVIPPFLRNHLFIVARRLGHDAPRRLFQDRNTAIVIVRGLIPPVGLKGNRFDLLVTAVPQTQVTSLAGGILWTTDLSLLGLNVSLDNQPMAEGHGPLYLNPFDHRDAEQERTTQTAIVIGGGLVKQEQEPRFILRQPSWLRAQQIRDRINERYEHEDASDVFNTAVAKSDSVIELNIPKRFSQRPQYFINLMRYLYIGRGFNYEHDKVHELARVLIEQPNEAARIILAWQALGRSTITALRDYYDYPRLHVRLATLEAGAKHQDERAVRSLASLTGHENSLVRQRAALILGHLVRSLRGPKTLHKLLNDDERAVRLAAYESLKSIGDPIIRRTAFLSISGVKFELDLVPSNKPTIYIAQSPAPRVVIFDQMLGFNTEKIISLWNNRLMLRRDGEHSMTVFYQKPGEVEAPQPTIPPTVANLVALMAHRPTIDSPIGFDMSFSYVSNVLHSLTTSGDVDAELELQINPAAATLARYLQQQRYTGEPRPDVGQQIQLPGVEQTTAEPSAADQDGSSRL